MILFITEASYKGNTFQLLLICRHHSNNNSRFFSSVWKVEVPGCESTTGCSVGLLTFLFFPRRPHMYIRGVSNERMPHTQASTTNTTYTHTRVHARTYTCMHAEDNARLCTLLWRSQGANQEPDVLSDCELFSSFLNFVSPKRKFHRRCPVVTITTMKQSMRMLLQSKVQHVIPFRMNSPALVLTTPLFISHGSHSGGKIGWFILETKLVV